MRGPSQDCVWDAATPAGYTVLHRDLVPAHTMFPPQTWQYVPIKLHWCVALCMKKTNHSSHHYICLTPVSYCSFGLDVMNI
jgi:hypothetical protein